MADEDDVYSSHGIVPIVLYLDHEIVYNDFHQSFSPPYVAGLGMISRCGVGHRMKDDKTTSGDPHLINTRKGRVLCQKVLCSFSHGNVD